MEKTCGVFETKNTSGMTVYRSSINYKKKHISLGTFATREEAREAYLTATELLSSRRLHVEDYPGTAATLPFEKWVVLINFRDTGRYFKTPILLRTDCFFYYYDVSLRLTFDHEDLAYFATHKIARRGSHLFTSEGGRQCGILTRFGIHPYAVPGHDYTFLNGDPCDLRRANIRILNPYHGVRKETRQNMPVFTARIHVNGDIVIGSYPTAEEAAIAYNKAAALLQERGCQIQFPENKLPEMDEYDYERIYHLVPISEKLRTLAIPALSHPQHS